MTFSEFWNAAFLAALHRLSAAEAKKEADVATQVVIQHWHQYGRDGVCTSTARTDLDIVRYPRQIAGYTVVETDVSPPWPPRAA